MMRSFKIGLTRTRHEYAEVIIEAVDIKAAKAQALKDAKAGNVKWDDPDDVDAARVISEEEVK